MNASKTPYLIIDVDSHVGCPLDIWDRYLDEDTKRRPDRPRFESKDGINYFRCGRITWPSGATSNHVTPSGHAPGPQGGWDADFRLTNFQNAEGIDRSINMPFGVIWPAYLADSSLGNALCRAWNDWLSDFCSSYPQRMFGYGCINIADPAEAVREMRRCVAELGFPSVNINPSSIGKAPEEYRILSDEFFYPIYEAAQALGIPVSIHAFPEPYIMGHEFNFHRGPNRADDGLGFPIMGLQLFRTLVKGGVCETFPNLKFGIMEAGTGWAPIAISMINERMEKFEQMYKAYAPKMRLKPEEYLQRQIYVSFELEDPFIADFIRWTGAPNRLLMAADYPHLEFEHGQLAAYLKREDLSAGIKRLTLRDNPLEYLRWEDTAVAGDVDARPTA